MRSKTDFQRVRREGRPYAHPLFVLVARRNDQAYSRFGVAAGRSLGGAVERNRAKRRLREAIRAHRSRLQVGWDFICMARAPILTAEFAELRAAIARQLDRAGALKSDSNEPSR